jgi:hypothetical protein
MPGGLQQPLDDRHQTPRCGDRAGEVEALVLLAHRQLRPLPRAELIAALGE